MRPHGKSRMLTIRPDDTQGLTGLRATHVIVDDPIPTVDVPFLPFNGAGLANLTGMVKEMERRLTVWPKDEAADASVGKHWEEPTVSVSAPPDQTEGGPAAAGHETRSGE